MNKLVMIGAAVAVAAGLGVFVQQQLRPQPTITAIAPGATDADNAPSADQELPLAPETPAVPESLPQFELADRDGKLRRLGEWKGQPLLVNYWATWCAPCRREIPLLNDLRVQRKGQRLEVIGIAVDFRDDVLKYAEETTISYPLLIGEEEGLAAVTAVGMQPAFPFTLFADSQQRIVALKVGELHQDEADLILDKVAEIDAGTLALGTARELITAGLQEIATRRAAEAG